MVKTNSIFIGSLANLILTWFRYVERFINHRIIPDKLFLSLLYRVKFKKKLDWKNPKTFNEKINWLKLNDRRPEYTVLCDKYKVREYISKTIGEQYLIPSLGVWDHPDEIDFDKLPNQFVLKCNHDSGSICICKNKDNFNIKKAKEKINKSLKFNYYIKSREWPYKDISHKIIAEEYITDGSNSELDDYKVMLFNGKAHYIRVCFNRLKENANWYDLNWNFCDIGLVQPPGKNIRHQKPLCLNEMIELSERISKDIPFARIDWYIVKNKLYFGEITLFPNGGFGDFEPKIFNTILGDLLKLPNKNL